MNFYNHDKIHRYFFLDIDDLLTRYFWHGARLPGRRADQEDRPDDPRNPWLHRPPPRAHDGGRDRGAPAAGEAAADLGRDPGRLRADHRRNPRRGAAERQLRPDARALPRGERGLHRILDRPRQPRPPDRGQPRRLGRAGALGGRGAERAGGDAGAGLGHRPDRRGGQAAEGLAGQAAAQFLALHLDHRLPCARGEPQGHQGLGRPRGRGRAGDHAEPQDLGRGALELSRRLGLGGTERSGPRGLRGQAVQERPGAGLGRARGDHDLLAARDRRRAAGLGERGLPGAQGTGRGPVRHRRALGLGPGRAAGRHRRGQHRQ